MGTDFILWSFEGLSELEVGELAIIRAAFGDVGAT